MSLPELVGEPVISQDGTSVWLNCVAKNAEGAKTKWDREGKEIKDGAQYKMTTTKDGDLVGFHCEIVKYTKDLAGVFNLEISNAAGSVNSKFTVSSEEGAPEFSDKPHIVSKDGGNIIGIKARAAKSEKGELKVEWFKDGKPVEFTDRLKALSRPDKKNPGGTEYVLQFHGPATTDQGKYKCVLKNDVGECTQSLDLQFD